MLQPVGHLDFYVNGGSGQPGCDPVNIAIDTITEDMVNGIRELGACNHLRSIEFFIDSLVSDRNYVGYECGVSTDVAAGYDRFLQGQCYQCGADKLNCAQFGMNAALYPTRSRINVPLYFDTDKDVPYERKRIYFKS